ncbi:MAG: hypothetical protein QXO69_02965, partial [archaeon]
DGLDDDGMPVSSIIGAQVYDNQHSGAEIQHSQIKMKNSDFTNNGIVYAIYTIGSKLYLENGNLINNEGYGLYEEPMGSPGGPNPNPFSVYWRLTEDTYCTNNHVKIASGAITPAGGKLIAENCTVNVGGNIVNFSSGQVGIYFEKVDETVGGTFGSPDYGITGQIYTESGSYVGNLVVEFYENNPTNSSGYYLKELGMWVDAKFDPEPTDLSSWILKLYYTDKALEAAGLTESTLKIQYYNGTSGTWVTEPDQGVNETGNYVWANLTHFSIFGLFGTTTGGSSGGVGSAPIGVSPSKTYSWTSGTFSQALRILDSVIFSVNGEQHTAKLTSISQASVVLTINSAPQYVTINKGESKNVDVNQDGTADITITLNKIESNLAYLTFARYAEPAQPPAEKPTEEGKETGKEPYVSGGGATADWLTPVAAAVIVIAAVIIAWQFLKNNKKKRL